MTSTTSTIASNSGLTELELKRQAVLASLKKKSVLKSQSPAPDPARIEGSTNEITEITIYEAVADLRSLGYSFDRIVQESRVSREFLADCFLRWKYPVPPPSPPSPLVETQSFTNHFHQTNSETFSKPKPLYANRTYKISSDVQPRDSPSWLKELVIDLQSSGDESSDDESSGNEDGNIQGDVIEIEDDDQDSEDESEVHAEFSNEVAEDNVPIGTKRTSKEDQEEVDKRRKLSNTVSVASVELTNVKEERKSLLETISNLSKALKSSDNAFSKVEKSLGSIKKSISQKQSKVLSLENQLEILLKEISIERDKLEELELQRKENQELKFSLAESLVKLEDLENKEKDLVSQEKKKQALRDKLLAQMKDKKKEPLVDDEVAISSEQQDFDSKNDSSSVYKDTIHKIPKVIRNISLT